ncbi:MAG TPA: metalloregulator ArsR/SmtB family transcription factor [Mycobacteriales bacterium]|nr:metalloregulator ArsR/SmtB family transcription factor [Mycobacteriales bacterium]
MAKRAASTRPVMTQVDTQDPAVDVLKALSDPIRLWIMSQIVSTNELACTSLEEALPVSKSTISYHMKILRGAGLINIRKQGKFYHYTARTKEIEELMPGLVPWLVKRSSA